MIVLSKGMHLYKYNSLIGSGFIFDYAAVSKKYMITEAESKLFIL